MNHPGLAVACQANFTGNLDLPAMDIDPGLTVPPKLTPWSMRLKMPVPVSFAVFPCGEFFRTGTLLLLPPIPVE
jgi:hypothetical protein